MKSFTAMRKAQEDFRIKLMNLICQSGPGDAGDAIASDQEKNMQQYYYYLHYGIDTIHAESLEEEDTPLKQELAKKDDAWRQRYAQAKKYLTKNLYSGSKKKLTPDPKHASKMKHFYNCLGCIMTYNLQTLCLKSMQEFTNYIMDVGPIIGDDLVDDHKDLIADLIRVQRIGLECR
ncbi:Dynein heavy chain 7, axonemal, partial [Operophtera brumata]